MASTPGALFVVDICREQNAINEAMRLGIPIVAIVDSNADPDPIRYVIHGNDDAVRGVKIITEALAKVMKDAEGEYSRLAADRQRQKDAEQVAQNAQERAARRRAKRAPTPAIALLKPNWPRRVNKPPKLHVKHWKPARLPPKPRLKHRHLLLRLRRPRASAPKLPRLNKRFLFR